MTTAAVLETLVIPDPAPTTRCGRCHGDGIEQDPMTGIIKVPYEVCIHCKGVGRIATSKPGVHPTRLDDGTEHGRMPRVSEQPHSTAECWTCWANSRCYSCGEAFLAEPGEPQKDHSRCFE